ncbi:MAG: AIR synthase-related protein, partial [Longicatena sp.]
GGFDKPLGEVLLTPTKIYVKAIKHLLTNNVDIKGMSHITGGGFYENVPRMLKEGLGVSIDTTSFPRPEVYNLIMKTGGIPEKEMYNVFNMGIGFIMAVNNEDVEKVQSLLKEINEESYVIGEVTSSGSVDLKW